MIQKQSAPQMPLPSPPLFGKSLSRINPPAILPEPGILLSLLGGSKKAGANNWIACHEI
jgi:hypothetical protein